MTGALNLTKIWNGKSLGSPYHRQRPARHRRDDRVSTAIQTAVEAIDKLRDTAEVTT